MNKDFEITALPKEKWKGIPIPLVTRSDSYYDMEIDPLDKEGCSIRIVRKASEQEIVHTPEEYDFPDSLYQDHWANAEAYGVVSAEGKLLACIEVCPEEWSNRLMVTELWVTDELQGNGIGKRLMDKAKEIAGNQNRRAIILETQSCNTKAIGFYLHQGFELIGFDTCCYTNADIKRHEIRFNLGYFFHREGIRRKEDDSSGSRAESEITAKQYEQLFMEMNPGYFERDYVRTVPENEPASEMLLCLKDFDEESYVKSFGDEVSFGYYHGNIDELKAVVAKVVPHWSDFFNEDSRVYCGFVNGRVASFCMIDDFGEHTVGGMKWKIGGPACVGTLKEFRNRGIGLSMVREVTKILKQESYDHSYIHYTYETDWYGKLGYKTFIRWSGKGFC